MMAQLCRRRVMTFVPEPQVDYRLHFPEIQLAITRKTIDLSLNQMVPWAQGIFAQINACSFISVGHKIEVAQICTICKPKG
jgi:hypothetical protein